MKLSDYCRSFPSGIHQYPVLTDYEKEMFRLCDLYSNNNATTCYEPLTYYSSDQATKVNPEKTINEKPSLDQLEHVKTVLSNDVSQLLYI